MKQKVNNQVGIKLNLGDEIRLIEKSDKIIIFFVTNLMTPGTLEIEPRDKNLGTVLGRFITVDVKTNDIIYKKEDRVALKRYMSLELPTTKEYNIFRKAKRKKLDVIASKPVDKQSVNNEQREANLEFELKMGIETEYEHAKSLAPFLKGGFTNDIAELIALDHLREIPDYYTRLRKMESEVQKKSISVDTGNSVVKFNVAKEKLQDMIKNAVDKYTKLHGKKPDLLKKVLVKLPGAVDKNGKEININEYLKEKKAFIPIVQCGNVLLCVYAQVKSNSEKPIIFVHEFKEPAPMVCPVDSDNPVMILPTAKYTPEGLI